MLGKASLALAGAASECQECRAQRRAWCCPGPRPTSPLLAAVYVDPDFHSHPPGTGLAGPGCSGVVLTVHGRDTRAHAQPPRLPSLCRLSPRPMGRGLDKATPLPPRCVSTWPRLPRSKCLPVPPRKAEVSCP